MTDDEVPAFQEIVYEDEPDHEMPPLAIGFDDTVPLGAAEFDLEPSGQRYGLAEEYAAIYAAEEAASAPEPRSGPQAEPEVEPQRDLDAEPQSEPQSESELPVAVADTNPHGLLLNPTGDENPLFHSNVAFREIPLQEHSYLAPDYSGPADEHEEQAQPEYGQSAGYGSDSGYGQQSEPAQTAEYGRDMGYGRSFGERFDQAQPGAQHDERTASSRQRGSGRSPDRADAGAGTARSADLAAGSGLHVSVRA